MKPTDHREFVDDLEGENKTFPDEIVAIEVPACQNHDEEWPASKDLRFSVRSKAGYTLSVGDQHITLNGHEVVHLIALMQDVHTYVALIKTYDIDPVTAFEMLSLMGEDEEQLGENES